MTSLLARTPPADRQFERLYRKHLADVYRYALVVLRNQADAEDVTQTTFLNAYRAMQGGERPESPKNWLIAIAHNVCRQRFRQAQRRPQEVALFDDGADLAVEDGDDEYTAADIQRALGFLAFNQRSALVMRELEGRSYAEIAEIMGLSLSAVETLIFRARRALREQLEGALTCAEAELLLSRQIDGVLTRTERGQLRAHLRECEECSGIARSQRASRGALKALFGGIPVPASLSSLFGGGTTLVATKAAAIVFAGAVVGGVGFDSAKQARVHPRPSPAVPAQLNQVPVVSTPAIAVTLPSQSAKPKPAQARGFVVPKGAKHLKVVTHVQVARGFYVPPGRSRSHLSVFNRVRVVPPRPVHPARPAHPVTPAAEQMQAKPPHPAKPVKPVTPPAGPPAVVDVTRPSQAQSQAR